MDEKQSPQKDHRVPLIRTDLTESDPISAEELEQEIGDSEDWDEASPSEG